MSNCAPNREYIGHAISCVLATKDLGHVAKGRELIRKHSLVMPTRSAERFKGKQNQIESKQLTFNDLAVRWFFH